MEICDEIRNKLALLAEEDYKKFISSLVPGEENIIGVRTPNLRVLAKEIAANDWKSFVKCHDALSLEEKMLQGMVIALVKVGLNERLAMLQDFIPKIDNWAVCDSFCSSLKFVRRIPELIWEFLQPYLYSEDEFETRFGIVMLLCYFVTPEYIDQVLEILDSVPLEGYYAKMAAAWAVSVCYVNYPEKTEKFLNNCKLDDFTYNKSLSKIVESNRVSASVKKKIRGMARKPGKARQPKIK